MPSSPPFPLETPALTGQPPTSDLSRHRHSWEPCYPVLVRNVNPQADFSPPDCTSIYTHMCTHNCSVQWTAAPLALSFLCRQLHSQTYSPKVDSPGSHRPLPTTVLCKHMRSHVQCSLASACTELTLPLHLSALQRHLHSHTQ